MSDELYSILHYNISNLVYTDELDLSNLWIFDIDMVLRMDKFQEKIGKLDIRNNDIRSIAGIQNCKRLVYINISHNNIRTFRSLPLLIEQLLIQDNLINKIILRRYYEKLHYLDISNNNINDLDFLKFCPNLRHLNINNNPIKNISPICKLKSLECLEVNERKYHKECILEIKQGLKYQKNMKFLTTNG